MVVSLNVMVKVIVILSIIVFIINIVLNGIGEIVYVCWWYVCLVYIGIKLFMFVILFLMLNVNKVFKFLNLL